MGVSIAIRDVPEQVRDELAARAAQTGRSLQEYLRNELIELARRPSAASVLERVRQRLASTSSSLSSEQILGYRDADRR
jgi:plasmid stability protein